LAIQPPVVTGDIYGRVARITFRSSLLSFAPTRALVFESHWAEARENYASRTQRDQPGGNLGLHYCVVLGERCGNLSRQSWGDFEVIS
jgi:hypothetical protein